jgi:hypothetical protein
MIEKIVRRRDGVKEFSDGIRMEKVDGHLEEKGPPVFIKIRELRR